jgi:hypothetical protein
MDGVVGGFGYANPKNVDDASSRGFFPRADDDENLGENLFLSDGNARKSARAASPGKASLDAFVAATSAEAVSLVGRAALAIGNAVVDGIEGTADFVHHAAKQADRIANKAASPTPGGRGGGLRGALAVLSPSGGNRRSGSVAPPVKQTEYRAKTRVLGLGATGLVSPLKKTGVGGGFRSPAKPSSRAGRAAAPAAAARADDSGDEWGWAAGSPTKDELRGAVSSAVAHFRRELEASRAENASLRKDLCGARAALAAAAEEAEGLKQQNLGLQRRQAQREREREGSDPLAEQVRCQLETLVAEKAKLAQENNELWRENESLQELLMHSNMATEAESLYSAGGALADLVEKPAPPQTHFESKLAEATTTSGSFSEATMSGSPTLEDTLEGDDELLLERREVDAVRRDGPATESAGALKVSVSVEEVSTERGAAPSAAFETGVPSETAFPSTDAEPSALEEPSLDASSAVAETPAARVVDDASGEGKENVEKENVSSTRSAAPEPKGASGGKKKKGKKGKR